MSTGCVFTVRLPSIFLVVRMSVGSSLWKERSGAVGPALEKPTAWKADDGKEFIAFIRAQTSFSKPLPKR